MKSKIDEKIVNIAVLGLGYVGLPLAIEFAKNKFNVVGIDPDKRKIKAILEGHSYITDIRSDEIKPVVKKGFLSATADFAALEKVDVIFICVPTPFNINKEPDVSYVISASQSILKHLQKGQLIILESTTYPGTTEEVVLPILESNGLKCGQDFFLVFSPERVDPGNKCFSIRNTPKVIGGIDPKSTQYAKHLYEKIIADQMIIEVSNPKIAEMTKLLENIFRSVNIALINELTLLCDRMNIDIWEVIDAASSKPFGYMPFYPGPGVGGHCIPVDPYYLSWKAREYDFHTRFIELAAETNHNMPRYVVQKIGDALNNESKSIRGSKILALGIAFKKDINDARNSPALVVIDELIAKGADVSYHDPYISAVSNGKKEYFRAESSHGKMLSKPLTTRLLKEQDCVVILVDHDCFDLPNIVRNSSLIVDTKNVTKNVKVKSGAKIVKI